jgi:zinc transporter ZupT
MLESDLIQVLLASGLASAVTAFGILLIAQKKRLARKRVIQLKSFAAGLIITITFMHIIPKSFDLQAQASSSLLLGFVLTLLANHFLGLHSHQEQESSDPENNIIPALGIGFHSLVDGIIYSVTFNVSVLTGILAAIGMVFHELPEGIISFVLFERSNLSRRKALIYALLTASLSTPLGALLSYPLVDQVDEGTLGFLLGLSAGVLIYVGASHLLPSTEEAGRKTSLVSLAGGILIGLGAVIARRLN